jgi:autotransporter-associated beta strand protein
LSGDNSGFDGVVNSVKSVTRFASASAGSAAASWTISGSGLLDFGGGTIHFGSLATAYTYVPITTANASGDYVMVVGERNEDSSYLGVIGQGTGATSLALTKSGSGIFTLGAANTYKGATTVDGGTLRVDGSLLANSTVTVNAGGTLGGNGIVNGSVTVDADGHLAPGDPTGSLVVSSLSLAAGAAYDVQINGSSFALNATEEYGRTKILTGSINVEGVSLTADMGTYLPTSSDILFGIVQNETANAISGTFEGLPEGEMLPGTSEYGLRISYTGNVGDSSVGGPGTGNDIILYSTVRPQSVTLVVIR